MSFDTAFWKVIACSSQRPQFGSGHQHVDSSALSLHHAARSPTASTTTFFPGRDGCNHVQQIHERHLTTLFSEVQRNQTAPSRSFARIQTSSSDYHAGPSTRPFQRPWRRQSRWTAAPGSPSPTVTLTSYLWHFQQRLPSRPVCSANAANRRWWRRPELATCHLHQKLPTRSPRAPSGESHLHAAVAF